MNDYYVYVYIDPRNYEEFYYGKGCGSRKNAHLSDTSDGAKTERIEAIQKEGLKPIIRVIAAKLSEHDALLIEKTLLWKLGRQLTNVAPGHYGDYFRPHNTIHVELAGFDFQNGLYYYNVGEGLHRNWDDYREFGFVSAGQGTSWRDAICGFQPGDVIVAYLKTCGYVGVGRITEQARPIREVTIHGQPLLGMPLRCKNMADNVASDDLCEYACVVEWLRSVPRDEAKWQPKAGLFTTPLIRASLAAQPNTVEYLEREFSIVVRDILA